MVEQERLTKDFEKWMHRKCAFESDEIVNPKLNAKQVELCFRCGEGLENPVRGPLYLYEVGEEVESITVTCEGDDEMGESIPFDVIKASEVTERTLDPEAQQKAVDKQNEVQSEDAAIPEEVDAAEPPTDGDAKTYELDPEKTEVIVTIKPEMREVVEENVTATLEEQIAALRAKIDAYEAKKE